MSEIKGIIFNNGLEAIAEVTENSDGSINVENMVVLSGDRKIHKETGEEFIIPQFLPFSAFFDGGDKESGFKGVNTTLPRVSFMFTFDAVDYVIKAYKATFSRIEIASAGILAGLR